MLGAAWQEVRSQHLLLLPRQLSRDKQQQQHSTSFLMSKRCNCGEFKC